MNEQTTVQKLKAERVQNPALQKKPPRAAAAIGAVLEAVQELKAERVQEELMAAPEPEPMVIWLKAERVQDPAVAAAEKPLPSFFEVAVSQRQRVSIELRTLQIV